MFDSRHSYLYVYSVKMTIIHVMCTVCSLKTTCKWFEFLGAMPDDYELYYGFTRFAIELNELNKDEGKFLPITDTRFRPDQRCVK